MTVVIAPTHGRLDGRVTATVASHALKILAYKLMSTGVKGRAGKLLQKTRFLVFKTLKNLKSPHFKFLKVFFYFCALLYRSYLISYFKSDS